MWLLIVLVLIILQVVFAVLGIGGVVDWSGWVLISPLLIAVGLFCFLFLCSLVNVMTPTKKSISSDTVHINEETSAEWIAQMIEQGNITLDNVGKGDQEEVVLHLPEHLKPMKPTRTQWGGFR